MALRGFFGVLVWLHCRGGRWRVGRGVLGASRSKGQVRTGRRTGRRISKPFVLFNLRGTTAARALLERARHARERYT